METKSNQSENVHQPQTELKHPGEWEADLNPSHMAGQNIGQRSDDLEQSLPTAYDVKDVHRTLSADFQDDELKQIPILQRGQRLQQGATYVDLRQANREQFTATGNLEAGEQNWYVPKDQVPYSLWNRLIGVDDPERIAERGDPDDR